MCLAGYAWFTETRQVYLTEPSFERFSSSQCALALFPVLLAMCYIKDLKAFLRFSSISAAFVFAFLLVIVAVGVQSFQDTVFELGSLSAAAGSLASDDSTRVLVVWGTNFAPLAGILNVSYYLHTAAVPVIRATNRPDRKYQDLAWGYFACMVTNIVAGVFGYCGFIGYSFRDYYAGDATLGRPAHSQMDQNSTNMFDYDALPACILKVSTAFWMLANYPVWSLFIADAVQKFFPRRRALSPLAFFILTLTIHILPLMITLFYPNVGSMMAYVGAAAGLGEVFVLPVLVHLKM